MKEFSTVPKKNIRLKHLFPIQITGAWGEDPIDGEGVVCLRAADILTDKIAHSTKNLTRRSYSDHDISTKILKKGDLIIEKSGGGEKQPVGRVIKFCLDEAALCSNFLSILRPDVREISSNFGAYLLYSLWDCREVERHIKQTTGIQNLDSSSYLDVQISLPPIDFQRIAVDYLDRETTEIDALIAEKEHMLALIEEKREALISHAITHGLNPSVHFKSSGLDWLGDIPEHWNIERGKNLFSVRDERSETGDEELLSVSHITGVTSRAEKQVYMFKAEDMTGYKRCEQGDFITNTLWAWMGAMGISPLDGIVSPDYHVYIFKGELLPEFMELLCRSKPFIAEVIRWSKGVWSSRLRLYPENFLEIRFPIPPKSEQLELIAKIEKEDAKTKELKNVLTNSIALLKERRSSLITAAVTGQIEPEDMRG